MNKITSLVVAGAVGALAGCAGGPSLNQTAVVGQSPVTKGMPIAAKTDRPAMEYVESASYEASGPARVVMQSIEPNQFVATNKKDAGWGQDGKPRRIRSKLSTEEMDNLRNAAMLNAATGNIHHVEVSNGVNRAPTAGTSFESLDINDCCGGGASVPPDPELAVGPNHIIAVVNVALEIYDKAGNVLVGPITLASFFNGTPGCSASNTFDPNVLYDEEADRFIIGADGNGTDYCVAASQTGDPTGAWNRYGFETDIGNAFFDYPHAGVGVDAIYMGSNQFGGSVPGGFEARVFAMDKAAMYSGAAMSVETHSTGFDSTPQPMNLHGFNDGSWPTSGPHYIMTEVYDGNNHSVWSWSDPFGANVFTKEADLDLSAATGVAAGFPLDTPQQGGANIQANDWRGLDTEYRNGHIWMTNTISCDPGTGPVNCLRWAKIDPTGPTVVDAGVIASNGDYRTFPDLAANQCDDMAIGYTKSNSSMFPSVYVTGREAGDVPGTVQAEVELKAGEITYTAFDGAPHRWGDYTGMTIDPDGKTFWYLGEYSKNTGNNNGRWGTYVGSFSFENCGGVDPMDDIEASFTGVEERNFACRNVDTGQSVRTQAGGASAVNCDDLGLLYSPGDTIVIRSAGTADSSQGDIGGMSMGMDNTTVSCRNGATGQRFTANISTADWNCTALGLSASDGDRIAQQVMGTAQ